MRAVVISELTGPSGISVADVPEPALTHELSDRLVVIDVKAAGVSFPELLQTWGKYQHAPELPFTPGLEVSGIVRTAPEGSRLSPGDHVMAMTNVGGLAEVAVAPEFMTFALPENVTFAEGAATILNLHTAYFALHLRARVNAGETVVVHGAAGGLGTALCSIAAIAGARVVAVVSSPAKAEVARAAGANDTVLSDGDWRAEIRSLVPAGVNIVCDPVGGSRLIDSLRVLAPLGRYVVLGYTEGEVSQVKTNRLLLNNLDVVGAGWGAFVRHDPVAFRKIGDEVIRLMNDHQLRPVVGHQLGLDEAAAAFALLADRKAMGKVVVEMR